MKRNQYLMALAVTVILGIITINVVDSNPERRETFSNGLSIVEVKDHEYIKLVTPTGSGLTHSESCPNHGGN